MSMYAQGRKWFAEKRKTRAAGKPAGEFKGVSAIGVAAYPEKRTDKADTGALGPSEGLAAYRDEEGSPAFDGYEPSTKRTALV